MQPIRPLAAFGRPVGSSTPPIPGLTDFIGIYSQHGIAAGFQNNAALIQAAGDDDSDGIASTAAAPYPLNWDSPQWATIGANRRLQTWFDQAGILNSAEDGISATLSPSIDVEGESFDWIAANTDGLTTANNLPSTTSLTIFVAIDVSTLDVNRMPILKGHPSDPFGASGKGQFTIHTQNTGDGQIVAAQNSSANAAEINSKVYSLPPSTNGKLLLTVIFDRTASVGDQTKMWLNGVNVGVDSRTDDMSSSEFEPIPIGIGWGDAGGGVAYFDGSISNVWIATGAFNDARREEVEAYIAYLDGFTLG